MVIAEEGQGADNVLFTELGVGYMSLCLVKGLQIMHMTYESLYLSYAFKMLKKQALRST